MKLNVYAFGGKDILFNDSNKFSESDKIDNILGLFIKRLKEFDKVLFDTFTLGFD